MYHRIEFAIADTCFLIDWARFRYRDLLFKLFKAVFISEAVLREVKSENTVMWIATNLAKKNLALYTETEDEIEEARSIIEFSRRVQSMPSVDMPEALCLVIGRRRGYIVLTENRGAIIFADLNERYSSVVVWRSFEILIELHMRRLVEIECNDVSKMFRLYEEDTKHIFPRRDLEKGVRVLESELCGKN